MQRHAKRSKPQYTNPDHRPMILELRMPEDQFDLEMRKLRLRHDERNADQSTLGR